MDSPSIGRIVRYSLHAGEHAGRVVAAIINDVDTLENSVDLTLFLPTDIEGYRDRAESRTIGTPGEPGTWHWPERTGAGSAAGQAAQPEQAQPVAPAEPVVVQPVQPSAPDTLTAGTGTDAGGSTSTDAGTGGAAPAPGVEQPVVQQPV